MNDEAEPLAGSPQNSLRDGRGSRGSEIEESLISEESDVLLTTFRPEWKTRLSFILVLITETLERTAFYSLLGNMVQYLNIDPLEWVSYNAMDAPVVLNGVSYVVAIFGGWIADAWLGKFRTVIVFFVIYIFGYAWWPVLAYYTDKRGLPGGFNNTVPGFCGSHNNRSTSGLAANSSFRLHYFGSIGEEPSRYWAQEYCSWYLFTSIAVISLGYGSVRANIIPFGAHQFEHEGRTTVRMYFNWFYWAINVGAFLAFGVLGYIQQNVSYFVGYLIPVFILASAFIVFICGSCVFVIKSTTGSVLTTIVKIFYNALSVCCKSRRGRDVELLNTGTVLERPPCCLDYARVGYGGSFDENSVSDLKQLLKIFAVFCGMVPYWVIYYQMQTTFVLQGLHLRLNFGTNGSAEQADNAPFTMPSAWLSLFNVIFILLLVPVFDRIIYPMLDTKGWSPSLRTRVMIGLVIGSLAMVCAGVLEYCRLNVYWDEQGNNHTHFQTIAKNLYYAANLSVFWQVPQYVLIAISELFASIAGLELAYIYAPRSMQGIMMGLYWFSQGLGSLLGTAFLQAFKNVFFSAWDGGNINCQKSPLKDPSYHCRLDHYFYFLAGVSAFGVITFGLISWAVGLGSRIPLRTKQEGQSVVRAEEQENT